MEIYLRRKGFNKNLILKPMGKLGIEEPYIFFFFVEAMI